MSLIKIVVSILGRVMLCGIFALSTAGNKIPNFDAVVQGMEGHGVPQAQILLVGSIVFLLAGSLLVVIGFQARLGAFMLFLFLCGATYFFHNFWDMEGPQRQSEMIQCLKNVSMAGAMLFILANGSGAGSIDEASSVTSSSESHSTPPMSSPRRPS